MYRKLSELISDLHAIAAHRDDDPVVAILKGDAVSHTPYPAIADGHVSSYGYMLPDVRYGKSRDGSESQPVVWL